VDSREWRRCPATDRKVVEPNHAQIRRYPQTTTPCSPQNAKGLGVAPRKDRSRRILERQQRVGLRVPCLDCKVAPTDETLIDLDAGGLQCGPMSVDPGTTTEQIRMATYDGNANVTELDEVSCRSEPTRPIRRPHGQHFGIWVAAWIDDVKWNVMRAELRAQPGVQTRQEQDAPSGTACSHVGKPVVALVACGQDGEDDRKTLLLRRRGCHPDDLCGPLRLVLVEYEVDKGGCLLDVVSTGPVIVLSD
jgi:hypothetical protein